jgi:hypothetical protein
VIKEEKLSATSRFLITKAHTGVAGGGVDSSSVVLGHCDDWCLMRNANADIVSQDPGTKLKAERRATRRRYYHLAFALIARSQTEDVLTVCMKRCFCV